MPAPAVVREPSSLSLKDARSAFSVRDIRPGFDGKTGRQYLDSRIELIRTKIKPDLTKGKYKDTGDNLDTARLLLETLALNNHTGIEQAGENSPTISNLGLISTLVGDPSFDGTRDLQPDPTRSFSHEIQDMLPLEYRLPFDDPDQLKIRHQQDMKVLSRYLALSGMNKPLTPEQRRELTTTILNTLSVYGSDRYQTVSTGSKIGNIVGKLLGKQHLKLGEEILLMTASGEAPEMGIEGQLAAERAARTAAENKVAELKTVISRLEDSNTEMRENYRRRIVDEEAIVAAKEEGRKEGKAAALVELQEGIELLKAEIERLGADRQTDKETLARLELELVKAKIATNDAKASAKAAEAKTAAAEESANYAAFRATKAERELAALKESGRPEDQAAIENLGKQLRLAEDEARKANKRTAAAEAKAKTAEGEAGSAEARATEAERNASVAEEEAKKEYSRGLADGQQFARQENTVERKVTDEAHRLEVKGLKESHDLEVRGLRATHAQETDSLRRELEAARELTNIRMRDAAEILRGEQARREKLEAELAVLKGEGRTEDQQVSILSTPLIPNALKPQLLEGETRTSLVSGLDIILQTLANPPEEVEAAEIYQSLMTCRPEQIGIQLGRLIASIAPEKRKVVEENLIPIWSSIDSAGRRDLLVQLLTRLRAELSQGQLEKTELPDL